MEINYTNAIGRRKSAVARVYLAPGTGKITINKKDLTEYFPSAILQYVVKQPLNLLNVADIARALVKLNAEDKKALKSQGFLTRDSRAVERKKPGQPKARRRFQFSKR